MSLIILSEAIPSSIPNIMNTPSSTPPGFFSFPGPGVASAILLAPAASETQQICFLCPDPSSQEEPFTLTAGGRDPGFIALAELWQVWARLGDLLGFWVRTSVNANRLETCKSSLRGSYRHKHTNNQRKQKRLHLHCCDNNINDFRFI